MPRHINYPASRSISKFSDAILAPSCAHPDTKISWQVFKGSERDSATITTTCAKGRTRDHTDTLSIIRRWREKKFRFYNLIIYLGCNRMFEFWAGICLSAGGCGDRVLAEKHVRGVCGSKLPTGSITTVPVLLIPFWWQPYRRLDFSGVAVLYYWCHHDISRDGQAQIGHQFETHFLPRG